MPTILAIIPARGGSKGLPGKNIKILAGKPMIAWTISAAREISSLHIIVSTDNENIAKVAREHGAAVPFLRPAVLSTDRATSVEVVLHALEWAKKNENFSPELLLLLQPTSPLRTSADIRAALDLQEKTDADAVVSVTPVEHPLSWLVNVNAIGRLIPAQHASFDAQRQNAAPLYALNGAIYLIKTSVFLNERKFIPEQTCAYCMPSEHSIDIDTPWDFYLADLVLKDRYADSARE